MAKPPLTKQKQDLIVHNQLIRMVENVSTMRAEFMSKLLDPRRDIDDECGYPKVVDIQAYHYMYSREGIAERVVNVYPQECWALDPVISETENIAETAFEIAWKEGNRNHHFLHYLERIDELSGVGHFGVLLVGLDDGEDLDVITAGVSEDGEHEGKAMHDILFMRAFDESLISISKFNNDPTSPRFGMPQLYDITFYDPSAQGGGIAGTHQDQTTKSVHWSRVLHVADNRKSSEVFGVPRQRPCWNRLYDLRKLLGGSAEMFWKGAFPGYSFEVNPDLQDATIDKAAMRLEFEAYSNGLQRYLALQGVTAKSLAVQVADPEPHIRAQLQALAITIGVPLRVFMGSEQAKLASDQDSRAWNKRLGRRQTKYIDPLLIRPFVDRLQMWGVLPEVDEYFVTWPDLNAPTDADKAAVALVRTEAMSKYVGGGVDTLVPPLEFLTMVCGMDEDEAEAIQKAALEHIVAANPDSDQDPVQGRNPTSPELAADPEDPETGVPAGVKPGTKLSGKPAPKKDENK